MAELTAIHETLEWLEAQALQLGVPSDNVTITNSRQKVDRIVREWQRAEQTAREIGYNSLPIALKALKQIKRTQIAGLSNLPEVFHTVPNIWLSGKVDTRKNPGFKPMSLSAALRKHRVVQPLLIEAWQLSEGDEQIQTQIEREYLTVSADDFEKALYRYIYDLEEVTLEEEFSNMLPATEEDVAASLKLATDPDRIYGVQKKSKN